MRVRVEGPLRSYKIVGALARGDRGQQFPCALCVLCGYLQSLRRALLLYNPESGRRRQARLRDVESVRAVLTAAGVDAHTLATTGPATAAQQVRDALASAFDTLIVCGGDGTINEVLPALADADTALGVVPLGTGNALANDLKLPRDPAACARLLLGSTARATALARIDHADLSGQSSWRYFISAAGVGADAQLVYELTLPFKQRWGMVAYYAAATRQWATHSFPMFTVEFAGPDGCPRREIVTQALAARITWFGGLLKRLAPGAALDRDDFSLVLFKTRKRSRYLRYMLGVWLERPWTVPDVEVVCATHCRCFPLEIGNRKPETRIYAEADGELLGTLPVSISMTSDKVNLLVPARAKSAVL